MNFFYKTKTKKIITGVLAIIIILSMVVGVIASVAV